MTPRGAVLVGSTVYPMEPAGSMGITHVGPRDFSGIKMKVRLQESGALGYLRCIYDNKTLLSFNDDDVILEDCEHYHWHLEDNDSDITEAIEGNIKEDEEDNEVEEEDGEENADEEWKEVLKRNYIAAVSVEGGKFYLVHLEKATEK
jgi:hypothetical protein